VHRDIAAAATHLGGTRSPTVRVITINRGRNSDALGLSYALVGNESLALYYVVARAYILRLPVAWVPAGTAPPPQPFPPPPPSPLNPKGCARFTVAGAGLTGVNGVYVQAPPSPPGGPPTFAKDATHQLYYFGGNWKLAHQGVGPVYYVATDTHGGAAQVPVRSWTGQLPYPTVTCTP
jgi:hypothetical protein